MTILHSTKTHTLSHHSIDVLRRLRTHGPIPCSGVNPGIVSRLQRSGLVELILLPSPYPTHRGNRRIAHLALTDAGVSHLRELEGYS
jgi:hypothetical protein